MGTSTDEDIAAELDAKLSSLEARICDAAKRVEVAAGRAAAAEARAAGIRQTLAISSLATILSIVAIAITGYFWILHSNAALLQSALQSFESG